MKEHIIRPLHPEKQDENDFSFLHSKKIVYLVNVDWFFISHRLPLALAARDAGAEVIVAAEDTGKGFLLQNKGIQFVPLPFSRQGTSLFHEIATIFSVSSFLRKIKPDILHTVSIKPVLYGAIFSRFFGHWPVVNAISGLGYVFSQDKSASWLRKIVSIFYKVALGNPKSVTIFQNPSDMQTMLDFGMILKEQSALIRGSGVNCSLFKPSPFPEKPVIMLPSRMLWDKGVAEFVEAAKLLNPKFPEARFVLVGASDDENPKAISKSQIEEWTRSYPFLEWWGAKDSSIMHQVISQATIVALPTYYPEGLPKCLLEGAACGKPLIASNIPACKEIVRDGINGTLIPPKNPGALAQAIERMLSNPPLMKELGENGRKIACSEFAEEIIVSQTFDIYRKLLSSQEPKRSDSICA